jgi:hypothetical protein
METTDRPMSTLMKVVFWFVAANALVGACSLIFFPADTARLFFWEIKPPINAALFGALYLGGAAVVALVTYRARWEQARFLIPIPDEAVPSCSSPLSGCAWAPVPPRHPRR